ncbi:hypothetical protein NM688_g5169 [Phlebia brevispora]|uniref:Uncharacterized protein n=1 Tax=Phlebia brevispora TaxID=194682 RepID=A0ACC1SZ99_9APHY|nr:hypothetical protein NM688_g5169 [Phlebia brevispora]
MKNSSPPSIRLYLVSVSLLDDMQQSEDIRVEKADGFYSTTSFSKKANDEGDVALEYGASEDGTITQSIHEAHFAPVDKGFGAWSFLIAAFFVEVVVWGFPNAYGAFLVDYLKNPSYATQGHASSLLPLIGPLSSGIMYCMIQVLVLVALQGVVYALGGCMIYAPCVYYMSEWFVERRGLANGVIDAGTAVGGLALPLMLPSLLSEHGSAKTLRYLSIVELGVLCITLPFIKARLPESKVHGPPARAAASRVWMKDSRLLFVLSASTLQGLGYFVPILWLPTYATSLGLSASNSSLALALLNGASMVGRLSMGTLSDRFNVWFLAASTLALTCLSTFILWGVLSYSLAGVLAFGVIYGCAAGGWTSMWTALIRPVSSTFNVSTATRQLLTLSSAATESDPAISTSIFGVLMFSRGVGNILSTPVSTALQGAHGSLLAAGLSRRSLQETGYTAAEGQYENMILYVGSCFAGATIITVVGWIYEVRHHRS